LYQIYRFSYKKIIYILLPIKQYLDNFGNDLQNKYIYGKTQTPWRWAMKKIVELVNMSFKNSQEYFKQSIDIQHIKAKFVETLSAEQKHIFDELLTRMYKLHNLDIEENIIHTYNIYKEVFKLR
jgi:hypothetical protein